MAKKKPNKQQRMKKRQEHAEAWTSGFNFAYQLGYEQAIKDVEQQAKRNILKFAHYGR